jgi:hypothetical protein
MTEFESFMPSHAVGSQGTSAICGALLTGARHEQLIGASAGSFFGQSFRLSSWAVSLPGVTFSFSRSSGLPTTRSISGSTMSGCKAFRPAYRRSLSAPIPVVTAVLAGVFLGEQMTWRKVAGLLLGIGGVAFVIDGRTMSGIDSPTGVAFTTAALLSLAGGTILFKRLSPNGGLWIGNGVQNLATPSEIDLSYLGDAPPSKNNGGQPGQRNRQIQ